MSCPHCGAAITEGARFCGTCGRTISSTEQVSHAGVQSSSTAEAPQLIGREIAGRYRVNAKLGEGGMGAVYKAEQMSLKRTVAVKLLRPEVASSQMLLARFNAEAQAVAKLSHPNTVNIYDFGQDSDGTLFIAMEYIDGKSLRHVIHKEAPLPLRRALQIAQQIAASLSDAHAASIVHRDLKPDNVMIQERGKQRDIVRVLDFGIAKLRDEGRQTQMAMTQAGDMLGTPQYMAPEQIRAESVDGRTDVYALGCMLYEMVTGRLPFEAPTVMALLSKHLLEVVVPPSQRRPELALSPAVDQLILSAMAKDPAARPATMDQLGEQIAALLATLPADSWQSTAQLAAQGSVPALTPIAPSAFAPSSPAPFAPASPPPPGPAGSHPPPSGPPPSPPVPASPASQPSAQSPQPPAFVPTPSGYVPQSNAPAYDPYAGRPAPAPPPAAKKSSAMVWVILGVLVLGGTGAGVYFGVIKKDAATAGSGADPGSNGDVDPGESPGSSGSAPDPAADPWANQNPTAPPPNARTIVQGISIVLPAGFTVVTSTADAFAATDVRRGLAIAIAALPPGTDDVSELGRQYAQENNLEISAEQSLVVAGQIRHVVGFTGRAGDDNEEVVQLGTALIGPGYRVGVFFIIRKSSLLADPSIATVGDELFKNGLFVPAAAP